MAEVALTALAVMSRGFATYQRTRRYYNPGDISRDFGRITDYHPPKKVLSRSLCCESTAQRGVMTSTTRLHCWSSQLPPVA